MRTALLDTQSSVHCHPPPSRRADLTINDYSRVLERVELTLKQQAALGLWARLKSRARISQTISSTKEEMEGALRKFSVRLPSFLCISSNNKWALTSKVLSQVRLEMKVQQMSSVLQVSSKRHADGVRLFASSDWHPEHFINVQELIVPALFRWRCPI